MRARATPRREHPPPVVEDRRAKGGPERAAQVAGRRHAEAPAAAISAALVYVHLDAVDASRSRGRRRRGNASCAQKNR